MKKIKISRPPPGKLFLTAIIVIQFALIAVMAWYLHITRISVDQQSTMKIGNLISKSVDALVWRPNADARTGRIYILEAKLTLPPSAGHFRQLYYNYTPAFPGSPEEVHLIDKNLVDLQEDKLLGAIDFKDEFDKVSKLQACARGYKVMFVNQKEQEGAMPLFTKKLQDGRSAYVSVDNGCTDNNTQDVTYLKQLQSY